MDDDTFSKKYSIIGSDLNRPWGGFYYIDPVQTKQFILEYFPHLTLELNLENSISPKLLFINQNSKLSWQYHLRRKEIWSVVSGPVGVVRSNDNNPNPMTVHQTGDMIILDVEERHRLVGLDNKSIVAELWCHIDPSNPSTENDIIRVQDDYQR